MTKYFDLSKALKKRDTTPKKTAQVDEFYKAFSITLNMPIVIGAKHEILKEARKKMTKTFLVHSNLHSKMTQCLGYAINSVNYYKTGCDKSIPVYVSMIVNHHPIDHRFSVVKMFAFSKHTSGVQKREHFEPHVFYCGFTTVCDRKIIRFAINQQDLIAEFDSEFVKRFDRILGTNA